MSSIISLDGHCITKVVKNVVSMFCRSHSENQVIDDKARQLGAQHRKRKFSFADFFASAVNFVGARAAHQTTYHLESNREQYLEDFDHDISNKCFHKQVSKDNSLKSAVECGNLRFLTPLIAR